MGRPGGRNQRGLTWWEGECAQQGGRDEVGVSISFRVWESLDLKGGRDGEDWLRRSWAWDADQWESRTLVQLATKQRVISFR